MAETPYFKVKAFPFLCLPATQFKLLHVETVLFPDHRIPAHPVIYLKNHIIDKEKHETGKSGKFGEFIIYCCNDKYVVHDIYTACRNQQDDKKISEGNLRTVFGFHMVADQDGKQKHAELGDDIAGI